MTRRRKTVFSGKPEGRSIQISVSGGQKELERARYVIASLYLAMTRQAWEDGPTHSEAVNLAQDWYHSEYGDHTESAYVGIERIYARKGKV